MKTNLALFFFSALSCILVSLVHADDSVAKSMKARLPDVLKAKDAGSIGEGVDGLLHVRADDASASVKKMVGAENTDRKSLFAALAKKTGGSSAAVAEKFAKAMIGKGKKGHWFRSSKGAWKQK